MEKKRKVALVTGASRGIGKSIALKLAQNGYNVSFTGRDMEKLNQLQAELIKTGIEPLLIKADITDMSSPKFIIENVIKKYGALDILVNNAGTAISKNITETTPDEWDLLMSTNAKSAFFLCKEAIPYLSKSENAVIINISSVVGRLGYENQAAYAASKHALMGFSKVLAKEVQTLGIRVHTIAPGGVETDMVKTMRPDLDTSKLIKPEEIAEIISFLINFRGNAMIDNIDIRRANGSPFA